MNFFEQQQRAKKNSKVLIALFAAGVIGVCFCVWYVISIVFSVKDHELLSISPAFVFQNTPYEVTFAILVLTLLVILSGCIYKISQLVSGGGSFVAKSLGGRLLSKHRSNVDELMVLNIVEEISIASGVPIPPVYILNDESINAFAAGSTYDDAVIGVTNGAIRLLNRDELQGVIAHEFGHIFNGDMKLNIRAIGILNGILFISLIGEFLLRSLSKTRGSSSSKKGNGAVILLIIGLALYIIGLVGVFFGNAIKAAINRQREYLADASSVQFTRLPSGLANALKKIGGSSSALSSSNASEFSHLYFSSGVKSFFSLDTHPPLGNRIKAIEPYWNGKYIVPRVVNHKEGKESEKKDEKKEHITKVITTAAILNELNDIGTMTSEKLDNVGEKIAKIPPFLYESTADTLGARFVIFSLLLDKDAGVRKAQSDIISRDFFAQAANAARFESVSSETLNASRDIYLNLIQLSMPTLKTLAKDEYLGFKQVVNELIEADKNVSWFELNLKYLVLYPLDIVFGIKKIPREIHTHIGAVKFEVEVLLSAVIYSQFADNEKALEAFDKMKKAFGVSALKYVEFENISISLLENAYYEVQKTKPLLRKKILEMAIMCLKADGENLDTTDMESIHALCALLHLPISL
ncbi:MAG: M48 family metallopeptidase [Campylobacteraceae bacterium]|jgi:Zn-dependent protease with chaperone function|nr:M48 family metallopeptidase [Campylobacteraceae bacterium]